MQITDILSIDIETASEYDSYLKLSDKGKELWELKCDKHLLKDNPEKTYNELYLDKSPLYPEFAKIICISVGIIHTSKDGLLNIRTTSFYGDEVNILNDLINLINSKFKEKLILNGHNIKEFDIPFICKRLLINSIKIPNNLNPIGKKPWELPHIDTMEVWKMGSFKNYISLDLLAYSLGVPSPKKSINGSMVNEFYYDNKINEIVSYCEDDVICVIQVYLKINNFELIPDKRIEKIKS